MASAADQMASGLNLSKFAQATDLNKLVQGLQITTAGGAIDAAIEVIETVEA